MKQHKYPHKFEYNTGQIRNNNFISINLGINEDNREHFINKLFNENVHLQSNFIISLLGCTHIHPVILSYFPIYSKNQMHLGQLKEYAL